MKNIFTRVSLIAALSALLSIAAFAQADAPRGEGQGDRQGRMRREGRMRGEGRGGRIGGLRGGRGMMERRVFSRLDLSEAQRNQLREIEARYGQGFKAQRQEVRQLIELRQQGATLTPEQRERVQQLRGTLRDGSEKMHAELLAVLTPEQRDQLQRMREEGEARRKRRLETLGAPDNDR